MKNTLPLQSTGQEASWKEQFARDGFLHIHGLFSPAEVEEIKETYEQIHAKGVPGFYEPMTVEDAGTDPLNRYPRVMQSHRFSSTARRAMLHPGVRAILRAIFGMDPLAAQCMYYFKPPGARGQAMHQDNFYLMASPGTCVAAWTAIDDADAENGGMFVVPKTHDLEIVCPDMADENESFTNHLVHIPPGMKARLVPMKAGDTLFFNGSLIHGSGPNRSKDRFRRSFICHYVSQATEKIFKFYNPLVTMDGEDLLVEENDSGGPCGTQWNGAPH